MAPIIADENFQPPPLFTGEYGKDRALEDLPGVTYALSAFLASYMVECEDYCKTNDPKNERLYFASGYGLIQCVKAIMSFGDEELLAAIDLTRHANGVAQAHRKTSSIATRLAGYVVGSSSGVGFMKTLDPVQRHAELIYAETIFQKAILGIIYSGDWLAFIKEALNMRTGFNTYRHLGKFMNAMDDEARARGEGPEDKSLDADFRSGVLLGVGASNLLLSLMPSRLTSIMEIFGYKGDRQLGLATLARAGGWTKESQEPAISIKQEGIRRPICDMTLLMFHLFMSDFTFAGVDIRMAQKILDWNMERYPNGCFFLLGQGRLRLIRGQPSLALLSYQKAIDAQDQYRNMHHISYWEMALSNFALWDMSSSLECWRILEKEAGWSKACYAYGAATCLLELGGSEHLNEAVKYLDKIPNVLQRIAGKSIPLEKFVARKARKFKKQGSNLILPALEFAYFTSAIMRAPRQIILEKHLPTIDKSASQLENFKDKQSKYANGVGYWDDLCLVNFLRGVCLRCIAYPSPDFIIDPDEITNISTADAVAGAIENFRRVLENGAKVELDHYLIYYTHYELGRLNTCIGKRDDAQKEFELVLSGKPLEATGSRQGKYSLESALIVKAHAAVDALE